MGAIIKKVMENSIGEDVGLNAGDELISINGNEINDILDYKFYSQEDFIVLDIKKQDDELWTIEVEKDYDEEIGLIFEGLVFDRMKVCNNHCIFCFIDQLPDNIRKTLYIKDDDYRYSFLFGNFITLSNLKEKDWQKILEMRLSPLYVSVHCMDPELRGRMLRNPNARNIRQDLQRLKDAGIEVHTQIVLCPGINDGKVLEETICELSKYHPSVCSIGIVPVGLTGHRYKLQELRSFTGNEAREIIKITDRFHDRFCRQFNRGFVYLADEFYIIAKKDFPDARYYDDYCQVENGIGLSRILLDDFAELEPSLPLQIKNSEVYVMTGVSALPVLNPIVDRLNQIRGLSVHIIRVNNKFFGGNVSVTGLLTGNDIINALGNRYTGKKVILPDIVFKEGQDILLDDVSLKQIIDASKADIHVVACSAESLVQCILLS